MSANERRIDVDLSVARNTGAQALPGTRNVPYRNFTIITATAGAAFQLGAGQGADLFPLDVGDRWSIDDPCTPAVDSGLFITNDPQPGASLTIFLGLDASRASGN